MTEEEMRELDVWMAENVFGIEVARDANGAPYDAAGVLLGTVISWIQHYTRDPEPFSAVKREIERRGWSWYVSWSPRHENGHVYFSVDSSEPPYSIIHTQTAETEELAGCLVLKEALTLER